MEYFSFIIYTLIFISISIPVAIVIFDFFDIQVETYGNYLLWFIALALFNAILPFKTKNIFEDNVKQVINTIATGASAPAVPPISAEPAKTASGPGGVGAKAVAATPPT